MRIRCEDVELKRVLGLTQVMAGEPTFLACEESTSASTASIAVPTTQDQRASASRQHDLP